MHRWLAALVFGALMLTGCNARRPYPVAGAVTVEGKPVQSGTVAFDAAEPGQPEATTPISDGRYATTLQLSGEPRAVKVRIQANWKTGRKIPVGPPAPAGEMTDEIAQSPLKYNQPGAFEIKPRPDEKNTFDFDLKER